MYKVELEFEHENHKCVVIFTDMGHYCGYVAVEQKSPLYGIKYNEDLKKPELLKELNQTTIGKRGVLPVFCWDGKETTPEILFNVHGGITFSRKNNDYPIKNNNLWWFGFDCAHAGDKKDLTKLKKYFPKEHEKIINSLYFFTSGKVRTKNYVEKECRNLAEQIACVESTY